MTITPANPSFETAQVRRPRGRWPGTGTANDIRVGRVFRVDLSDVVRAGDRRRHRLPESGSSGDGWAYLRHDCRSSFRRNSKQQIRRGGTYCRCSEIAQNNRITRKLRLLLARDENPVVALSSKAPGTRATTLAAHFGRSFSSMGRPDQISIASPTETEPIAFWLPATGSGAGRASRVNDLRRLSSSRINGTHFLSSQVRFCGCRVRMALTRVSAIRQHNVGFLGQRNETSATPPELDTLNEVFLLDADQSEMQPNRRADARRSPWRSARNRATCSEHQARSIFSAPPLQMMFKPESVKNSVNSYQQPSLHSPA